MRALFPFITAKSAPFRAHAAFFFLGAIKYHRLIGIAPVAIIGLGIKMDRCENDLSTQRGAIKRGTDQLGGRYFHFFPCLNRLSFEGILIVNPEKMPASGLLELRLSYR
jgi:hypothetical protein